MIVATALACIAAFVVAFRLFHVLEWSRGVVKSTRAAAAILRDDTLDDAAREKAIQRASLGLMGACGSILFRTALSCFASLVPVWLASATGLASSSEVFQFLGRFDVIVGATLVILLGHAVWFRLWPSN